MRRVRVEEAAAVGAELLDDLLAGHRPAGDEDDRKDDADRQQNADNRAGQIDPEVAQLVGLVSGKAAYQGNSDRDTDRGRHKVLHGQAGHLHQIARSGLTGIGLPVRVRGEAGSRVERLIRLHVGEAQAQEEMVLYPQEEIEKEYGYRGEREHAAQVRTPRLLVISVHPAESVHRPFGPQMTGRGERPRHVVTERLVRQDERDDQQNEEKEDRHTRTHLETLREEQGHDQKDRDENRQNQAGDIGRCHSFSTPLAASAKTPNTAMTTMTNTTSAMG